MKKTIYAGEYKALLALLREIRIRKGLRQADIAKRVGKPQSFVSNYERGERRLDILELRQICLALGVSLTEFIRRFEKRLG
mgnify:CR=1 FL=1